jgi:hypothetical protein
VDKYKRDLIELADRLVNELLGDAGDDARVKVESQHGTKFADWTKQDIRDRILMAIGEAGAIGRGFERGID